MALDALITVGASVFLLLLIVALSQPTTAAASPDDSKSISSNVKDGATNTITQCVAPDWYTQRSTRGEYITQCRAPQDGCMQRWPIVIY